MSGLVIDVSELVADPGATLAVHRDVPVPGLRGVLGGIDENEPLRIDLAADSVTDGIAVTGTVSGIMHLCCSRCLVDYHRSFEQRVDDMYYYGSAEERDGYEVEANHIDLEPMLRDVIVLAIPTRPLHDEMCRGLCSTCGADLNTTECGHTTQTEDLRWAPLRSALDRLERSS
jgi:uncharacterized protein